jgi:hypothetical protein
LNLGEESQENHVARAVASSVGAAVDNDDDEEEEETMESK